LSNRAPQNKENCRCFWKVAVLFQYNLYYHFNLLNSHEKYITIVYCWLESMFVKFKRELLRSPLIKLCIYWNAKNTTQTQKSLHQEQVLRQGTFFLFHAWNRCYILIENVCMVKIMLNEIKSGWNPSAGVWESWNNHRLSVIQFNSNILLNKCINTISNGIAHQA
jgi:hypothetical protein